MAKQKSFIEVFNHTDIRIPKAKIVEFSEKSLKILAKNHRLSFQDAMLTIVFVSATEIRRLNKQYRKKDKPTDVLSFSSDFALGELVLCPEVIKKYAQEHQVRIFDELTYVVLHGILHLLGYDHETSPSDAKKMFQLQDQVYNRLAKQFSLRPVQKNS